MQEGENSPEPSQKPKQEGSGGIAAYKVIFIFIRRSHYPVLLTALLSAIISGFPKPLISILTGRFLNTFAKYSVGILDEDQVRHNTAATIYALAIVGVGSWVVKALFTATWVAYGESQARAVREDLFSTLLVRHLGWFEAQEC
jgi:ABC-type multidrug transport system fused ATPase/permease subunit